MSAGFLGPCTTCDPCGGGGAGVPCDTILFLYGHGRDGIGAFSLFPVNEGATLTLTVARVPQVFSYYGTPAEYEIAAGFPPPVGDGEYYYDTTGAGSFWLNTAGVFSPAAAPAFYGVGAVSVTWLVVRDECGCPHMIPAGTGTLSWANGDVANKTIDIAITCPGPPTYWPCQGDAGGGEIAQVTLTILSLSADACAIVSTPSHIPGANIGALCTHDPPHPDWGTFPYFIRTWGAYALPTIGIAAYDHDGATYPVDTYLRETGEITAVGGATTSRIDRKFLAEGGRYVDHRKIEVSESSQLTSETRPTDHDTATDYFIDFGGGETITRHLQDAGIASPAPLGNADARLATAEGLAPDGSFTFGEVPHGSYGWTGNLPTYVLTIRASYDPVAFADAGFDPAKTYSFTGTEAEFPASPYDPDDWTEVADTGWDFLQEASGYTPTEDFTDDHAITGVAGRAISAGSGVTTEQVWKSQIDARQSRNGNPTPQQVEVRLKTYEDGILVSTGAWQDITDTTLDVDPPADLGGGSIQKHINIETRTTYINASCVATGPAIFVCHPGLSCP